VSLVDVLAAGAHPDDVELGCGGLLLTLRARGYRFAIVDATAGEKGSRGTRERRAAEAKEAAERLGSTARECLGLPDTQVKPTDGAVRLMVEALRRYLPSDRRVVFYGLANPAVPPGGRVLETRWSR